MKSYRHSLYFVAFVCLLGLACSTGRAFRHKSPKITKGEELTPEKPASATEIKKIFHGLYVLKVFKKKDHEELCAGESQIIAYDNFTSEITGVIPCHDIPGLKSIDIRELTQTQIQSVDEKEREALKLDSRLHWIKSMGGTTFQPNRPHFVTPIIQDIDKFKNLDITVPVTVKMKAESVLRSEEVDKGTVQVKIKELQKPYISPEWNHTFPQTLLWGMYAQGFDDLPRKALAGLYEAIEYRVNIRPFAILHVRIESKASDFEKSFLKGLTGDFLSKGVEIEFRLKELILPKI